MIKQQEPWESGKDRNVTGDRVQRPDDRENDDQYAVQDRTAGLRSGRELNYYVLQDGGAE